MGEEVILGLDSSGTELSAAFVAPDGSVLAEVTSGAERSAEALALIVGELFGRFPEERVTRVSVITGPGSYTGLRNGVSTAHGLRLGLNAELIGVPLFLARAESLNGNIAVRIPANPQEDFVAEYYVSGATIFASGPERVEPRREREAAPVHAGTVAARAALIALEFYGSPVLTVHTSSSPVIPLYIKGVQAKTIAERSAG